MLGLVPRESERSSAQRATRASDLAREGQAGRWEHGLAPKERRPSRFVQCPSSWSPWPQRRERRARASEAHVLGLVPRESERSGAQARYTRKPPRAVRGRAGTWEHGPDAEGTAASRSCSALPQCIEQLENLPKVRCPPLAAPASFAPTKQTKRKPSGVPFCVVADRGGAGEEGGGVIYSTQHARSSHSKI